MAVGHWSIEEHERFLEALQLYGKNWKLIQQHIGTRSATQTRSHAQKYFNRLKQTKKETLVKVRAASRADAVGHNQVNKIKTKSSIGKDKTKEKRKVKKNKRLSSNESNYTIEPKKKYYSDELDKILMINLENVDIDKFYEEKKQHLLEQLNPFEQDVPNSVQSSSLINVDCGSDSHAYTPWDSELDLDNFKVHPKNNFLLGESKQTSYLDEEDRFPDNYQETWSIHKSQTFSSLFE